MTTLNVNGRARKSLAEQLDRLDRILDGLANALNEAVAQAVQQAVKGVLTELLNEPTIRAALIGVAPVETPVQPQRSWGAWWGWCWNGIRNGLQAIVRLFGSWENRIRAAGHQFWEATVRQCKDGWNFVVRQFVGVWRVIVALRRLRGPVVVALVAGTATGVAAYFAGPWITAGVSGLGGFVTTLAVQARLALRQMMAKAAGAE